MDKNVSPYFDDGVEQFNTKLYKEILFNPGVPLQARELTQLQTLINEQLKLNLDQVYRDGSVIAGCVFTVAKALVKCATSEGLFYWNGRVYKIEAQDVAFNPVGEQKFGLQLVETDIDAAADSALNDPASGFPNYNLPGANRLKQEWQFVNITEGAPTGTVIELWVVQDSILVQEDEKSEYSLINDTLARRTFDESGHYLVRGMGVNCEDYSTDPVEQAQWLKVVVDPGVAYVKGYEIDSNYSKNATIDRALAEQAFLNENHTYNTGTTNYTLREKYAKEITAVTGQVQITNMRIDHVGGVGSSDLFTDADTATTYQNVDLSSVTVGTAPGLNDYTITTDYLLSSANGGTIDWSPAGAEPTGSYYVSFKYTKAFASPADYTFEDHPTINDTYELVWGAGDKPVNGTVFYIDYIHYLARTDLVSLDKLGNIKIKTGVNAHWRKTIIPDQDEDYLTLGYVKSMPNIEASGAVTYDYNYKRQTMRDLFKLRNRVTDIEYNQAELALEADAKGGELPTNLKGIFVDSFETWKKVDVAHLDFKCALNNIDAELTKTVDYAVPTINQANDNLTNTEVMVDGLSNYKALTKTGETVAFSQNFKTKVLNLNPYTFLKKGGTADVRPRVDRWIDTEIINLAQTNNVTVDLPDRTVTEWTWWRWWSGRRNTTEVNTNLVSSSVERSRTVRDTNIIRARQIPLAIKGAGWSENSRIDVYFDDKLIAATPTGSTTDVTDVDGTHLVVETAGTFTGTITVPPETRTGAHKITFKDIDLDLEASCLFTSTGIERVITNREITTNTFQRQRINRVRQNWWADGNGGGDGSDPIAQSFVFSKGKTFSGIDVYFKSQDYSVDAWLEIGYLVNGYPSQDSVFHRQTIDAGSVNVSANGTVATRINFTKPIHIPADTRFFITLGSESDQYYAYVSELGGTDLATEEVVAQNPYINGVFFQSSNNNTWTAFQNIDLTCRLIEGVYQTSGSIELDNKTGLTAAAFKFECEDTIPLETEAKYYYSTDNGVTYNYFKMGDFITLDALASQIRIKIDLSGSGSVTPLIDADSYSLLVEAYNIDADNYYVSRTVINVPEFNTVRLIYDAELSAGCSVTPQYSVDGGINWFNCSDDEVITYGVDEGINRYEYSRNITLDSLGPTETTFKARILLNNSANALVSPVVKNLKWIMKNV